MSFRKFLPTCFSTKFLVKQDCGKCLNNKDCVECNTKYCNKESLVPKQCLGNNGTICKTSFETPCFVERMKNNTGGHWLNKFKTINSFLKKTEDVESVILHRVKNV